MSEVPTVEVVVDFSTPKTRGWLSGLLDVVSPDMALVPGAIFSIAAASDGADLMDICDVDSLVVPAESDTLLAILNVLSESAAAVWVSLDALFPSALAPAAVFT